MNVKQLLFEGELHRRAGHLADAERMFRSVLEAHPGHSEAHFLLGQLAVDFGRMDAAVQFFEAAQSQAPQNIQYWHRYIDALRTIDQTRNGDRSTERGHLGGAESAVDKWFSAIRSAYGTGGGNLGLAVRKQLPWMLLLAPALAFRELGLYREAAIWLQGWLRDHCEDAEALATYSYVLLLLNRITEAKICLDRAQILSPAAPVVLINLARLLLVLQKPETACRAASIAVDNDPDNPEGCMVLAAGLSALGRDGEALPLIGRALGLRDSYAEAYASRALISLRKSKLPIALTDALHAVLQKPQSVQIWSLAGDLLLACGNSEAGGRALRHALAISPEDIGLRVKYADYLRQQGYGGGALAHLRAGLVLFPASESALAGLANGLRAAGLNIQAASVFRRAWRISRQSAAVVNSLGHMALSEGNSKQAKICYSSAVIMVPDLFEALCNLGNILRNQGCFDQALESYKRALLVRPDLPEILSNIGTVLRECAELESAGRAFDRALVVRPECAEAWANLGNLRRDQGLLAASARCLERALVIKDNYPDARSNLLMTLHYAPDVSEEHIFEKAGAFAESCESREMFSLFANRRDAERRLRVGYVSGDFGDHPVGYFLANVLASHDRDVQELFCYSNSFSEDQMTGRLRGAVDRWRCISGMSDFDAAKLVRQDEIDILVDLSGHTAKNRLLMFCHRAAPIQVTWLGYFGTTGLSSIDYILADRFVVPVGDERYFSEKVWRLEGSYLCYAPHRLGLDVTSLPALNNGHVTFGSFNNRAKLNADVLGLWAEILARLPGSRLFLKTKSLSDLMTRQTILNWFASRNVAAERLILEGQSSLSEALAAYGRMDIALDPFPFGGCATTAEALWMGVPVVTMRGRRWPGRMGESILSAIGMEDLVVSSPADYADVAIRLASDLKRLAGRRQALREKVENSVFCDGPRFARQLETTWREMWRIWCAAH